MSYYYNAFGFNIISDIRLVQVPEDHGSFTNADIEIKLTELTTSDVDTEYGHYRKNWATFCVADIGLFRITDGSLIEVKPLCSDTDRLCIFLMGSCMGAIFHQRKELVLHGSSVTRNGRTILFTGESGVGKSTIAAEFCAHGWKMLTDDVALIKHPKNNPFVQPSYPSQKLWKDSCDKFYNDSTKIHSVYEKENSHKYGINVPEIFAREGAVLTDIVYIYKTNGNSKAEDVSELEGIKLIMDNTYRLYMIVGSNLERQFQSCVDLYTQIHICAVGRDVNCTDSSVLYNAIIDHLENNIQ